MRRISWIVATSCVLLAGCEVEFVEGGTAQLGESCLAHASINSVPASDCADGLICFIETFDGESGECIAYPSACDGEWDTSTHPCTAAPGACADQLRALCDGGGRSMSCLDNVIDLRCH